MAVIGLDPGSLTFGVGILQENNTRIEYVDSLVIRFPQLPFEQRMHMLWHRLEEVFSRHAIEHAAIEEGFLGRNPQSMNVLAKVRGVVLGFLIHKDVTVTSYSPRRIKQALTKNGNAPKSQVNRMVKILLNMRDVDLLDDESDALAVAYCHLLNRI